jgi:hypothetical protein
MEANTIIFLFTICGIFTGFIIGFAICSLLTRNKKNKYDGTIIIDEADENGHAGLNLEFNIEYDELIRRNDLFFKIDNHLNNT